MILFVRLPGSLLQEPLLPIRTSVEDRYRFPLAYTAAAALLFPPNRHPRGVAIRLVLLSVFCGQPCVERDVVPESRTWQPEIFFGTITEPSDQILHAAATSSFSNDSVHVVLFFALGSDYRPWSTGVG